MNDKEKAAQILWIIGFLAERYAALIPLNRADEPPLLQTFFNGRSVIEQTIKKNGVRDPDLQMLLLVLLGTAMVSLDDLTRADLDSPNAKIRGNAIWRRTFLETVDRKGGVDACLSAMQIANDAMLKSAMRA